MSFAFSATVTPPSFNYKNGKAHFVDFSEAVYKIQFDVPNKKSTYQATIKFKSNETGFPIFDVVNAPTKIILDNIQVTATEVTTPNKESKIRIIEKSISPGNHELIIEGEIINDLVKYLQGQVVGAFWFSDLEDRSYLETYLPANYEFDQLKVTFQVSIIGSSEIQTVYTNGKISNSSSKLRQQAGTQFFQVEYPSYFTSSSLYFHLTKKNQYEELKSEFRSSNGKTFPIILYGLRGINEPTMDSVHEILKELENDYGPFLHDSLTIYLNQSFGGGMEYSGATVTTLSALSHELTHSYFARGVMPANGNAGWLDESIASWRDKGYQSLENLNGTSSMASHPVYTRETDRMAYGFGANLMAYFNNKTQSQGGLKSFLKNLIQTKAHQNYTTESFNEMMDQFFQISFKKDFQKYAYSSIDIQSPIQGWQKRGNLSGFHSLKQKSTSWTENQSPEQKRLPRKLWFKIL